MRLTTRWSGLGIQRQMPKHESVWTQRLTADGANPGRLARNR